MKKAKQLVTILRMLRNERSVTTAKVAKRLAVSRQTVLRQLHEARDVFEMDIRWNGKGIYIVIAWGLFNPDALVRRGR